MSAVCPLHIICKEETKLQQGYQFKVFHAVEELPLEWEILVQDASIFLQTPYLQALENAQPQGYRFFYLLIYQESEPIGVALAQAFRFTGIESVRIDPNASEIRQYFQRLLLKQLNFNFLIFGNATLTGEYGFHFKSKIPCHLHFDLLRQAANHLNQQEQGKTDILVIKDFFEDKKILGKALLKKRFHEIHIQPNMIMEIPQAWNNFGDYLEALRSKYRVRVKRAVKKLGEIRRRCLEEEDLIFYQSTIHQLYQEVANNAEMNVQVFPKHYFLSLKQQLKSDFQVLGYFLDDQLIGFCTTICDREEMEAHFLGFDTEINQKHQLYLNMLFDLIQSAIERRVKHLTFSRSAIEIKSSVGAIAYPMYSYTKHCNPLINSFLPFFFRFLGAEKEWVMRSPFKD